MLLDLAFPDCERVPDPEPPLYVRGVRIAGNSAAPTDENPRDLLYIKKQKSGVQFLCGGNRIPFATDLEFAEVFNKLEETFTMLRDWDMRLHQGIIEKKGFQYMLDASDCIFHRPISLTDSGHKLIAYTDRRQEGDSIFIGLIEKGYLPAAAIARMDQAGFILEKKAIVHREGIDGLSFPMLNGTIFVEQNYRYMLTMLLPVDNLTDGIFELFGFLIDQLTLYVETNGDATRLRGFAWTSLLTDLIEGKCTPAEFAERNKYLGLPEGNAYHLVSFRRKDGTMQEFIRDHLEQVLREEIVFIYEGNVFVVLWEGADRVSANGRIKEAILALTPVVEKSHLVVGISDRFETLCDLGKAYRQTNAARDLGLRISQNRTLEKLGIAAKNYDGMIFRYSDYYPYDMISGSPCLSPVFGELLAEDQKTAAGNLRLLYAYLKNDCSKTRTGAELFMHRNNIIYRISKLEESCGLSLSDEQVKTAFRLSFLALELLEI